MPDNSVTKANTHQIIDAFYEEEAKLKADEITFTSITLSLSASDIAMLEAISKRFGKNKEIVGRNALSGALSDMFSSLKKHERKRLAKEADDHASHLAQRIAEENGDDKTDTKINTWVATDRVLTKQEAKQQKAKGSEESTKETSQKSSEKKTSKTRSKTQNDSTVSKDGASKTAQANVATDENDSPEPETSETTIHQESDKNPKSMFDMTEKQESEEVMAEEQEEAV